MTLQDDIIKAFDAAYPGCPCTGLCRAPGRVNLLGEHVDYAGLPVLPMAVDRNIIVAFGPSNDNAVHIANRDPQFAAESFENTEDIPRSPQGHWANYVKAAIHGLNRYFALSDRPGMRLLFGSTLPSAAGLSSSSAMVIATAMAYLRIIDKPLGDAITRIALAEVLAAAERYTGAQGGGMDQAIILLAEDHGACKIDFFPLRIERVPTFDDHIFVVCDSMERARKAGTEAMAYNAGPRLCGLIHALVQAQIESEFGEDIETETLADLWYGPLCLTHDEVAALFQQTFPKPALSLADAARRLGLDADEVRNRWLGDLPEPAEGFALQARARHLVSEFKRVEAGRDALLAGDPATFGHLLDASHASCADDLGVSTPALDALTAAARKAGALGARLTGAGFGGCTVNLVPAAEVDAFRKAIASSFYNKPVDALDDLVFAVNASSAASYLS